MLKILLKSRLLALADQFAGQSKGKKAAQLGTWIALAVLGVLLLVCGGIGLNALFGGFCAALAAQGQTWAFFAAAGGLAFILALVLTFFYAQGVIFEAKDNELLLSMPIRPSAILASRIASVYFLNTLFSLLLLGAAGYTVSVRAGGLSALNVILLILCALLLPLPILIIMQAGIERVAGRWDGLDLFTKVGTALFALVYELFWVATAFNIARALVGAGGYAAEKHRVVRFLLNELLLFFAMIAALVVVSAPFGLR